MTLLLKYKICSIKERIDDLDYSAVLQNLSHSPVDTLGPDREKPYIRRSGVN